MNKEQSLALFAKGKDAWNAWAAERLAEREALKAAGAWVDSPSEPAWNQETRAWHEAAKAEFSRHIFDDEVDFSGFEFPSDARFGGAKFRGDARFGGAEFAGYAGFGGAKFAGRAGFHGAEFAGYAGFGRAKFTGRAWFHGAEFAGRAWFHRAEFAGRAWFGGAKFAGYAGFGGAKFRGDARFGGAEFAGYAGFHGAEFAGRARFGGAKFGKAANFLALRGESAFSFANAEFLEVPDFEQAHFAEAPRLDNLRIEPGGFWRPILTDVKKRVTDATDFAGRWRASISFWPLTWTAIKVSFRDNTNLAARWRALKRLAIQAHDHAREMEFFRGEIKARRWAKGNLWPSVFSYPYQWFADFGRSIFRPLAWWLASLGLFTCLYLGEQPDLDKHPMSGVGWTIARVFSFAGARSPEFTCVAGEGEPWLAALGLSLRKGLLFFGLDSTGKLSQVHGCLYGIYPKGEARLGDLPGSFSPVIPPFVAFLGGAQMLLSSVLIFLFLLAIRNHFRIK